MIKERSLLVLDISEECALVYRLPVNIEVSTRYIFHIDIVLKGYGRCTELFLVKGDPDLEYTRTLRGYKVEVDINDQRR